MKSKTTKKKPSEVLMDEINGHQAEKQFAAVRDAIIQIKDKIAERETWIKARTRQIEHLLKAQEMLLKQFDAGDTHAAPESVKKLLRFIGAAPSKYHREEDED